MSHDEYFSVMIVYAYKTSNLRSSHRSCSIKKVALKNFAKFTGKHLCQSLVSNKVAGLRLRYKCFPGKFAKFLRIPLRKTSPDDCFCNLSEIF